jgi:hypothetical protein
MPINRPALQTGHQRNRSSSVVESQPSLESPMASMTSCLDGQQGRTAPAFSFRLRLARNPKWRGG